MKVSKSWLQELVDLNVSMKEVEKLLPLRTIATKEINDDFIELDMKGYNRADLLSMRGIVREVAAITNSPIKFEDIRVSTWDLPTVETEVTDQDLIPVYCLAKIENISVGQSSEDEIKKLSSSGMRSINNIADLTNLIMLEFGQPMHAFDASKVKGQIKVRLAKSGEKLTTLDQKERVLTDEDIVIADESGPIALAGVMGGKDSEISNATTTILLEAAIFDPISIRKTAQRHNLASEASKRFQHGLTKTNLMQALSAAISKYEELGGKLTAISLNGELEDPTKVVKLTQQKVNSLIGVDISASDVKKYLESLGFKLGGESPWEVTAPYWRLDINLEEDLIEEVARTYGYENIPAKPLEGELPEEIDQKLSRLIYDLKKRLADGGLTEIQTYSFFSTQVLKALGFNEENAKNAVKVANPISSETEYLRTFIWPNLVEVIEKNSRQGYSDIAIFEVGKVYSPQKEGLPKESYRLSITLMNETDNPVEELITILKTINDLIPVEIERGGLMKELETIFHPTRFASVKTEGKVTGGIAEVHPRFLNQFGLDKRVAIVEISIA
jgi:phenylalanyl-tRNA synthetase beta chain